ncbi:putative CDP-alcohol phosphatidyltransferase class-I family protein C22A12.08c [Daldinia childiae]|uniref:putative CDP-alcohol phosphatidyltransferase class-I family protein C22A12.08c n=1 Tax=Daldinia childiae TaxID=326645 RepID=UPI0014488A10|nr:putative CDP-alcohol phosphatidyltransferase class-I family protein C22A12.08c [Daldinia childiae]KAF3058111.1 putative CDP-alcohol phosphatidyltransferase class-I family protein C22A12.08c [Daldinia childiae]
MPGLHIANGAEPTDSLPAFVFDIDGVFIRGEKLIPGARETIRLLQRRKDPFIFLTNGGGHTEQSRVEKLGQRLGLTLDVEQFVQSHTPYYDLVPEYGDKTVLVLGAQGDQIRDLAHKYGFKKVLTSSDIMAERPLIHPFPEMTKDHHEKYGHLQIITDLLLSRGGFIGTKSPKNGDTSLPNNGYQQDDQPKLFFCNPDFQWSTEYPDPRLAQGAALAALKGLWDEITGGKGDLLYSIIGKPTEPTYVYAEKVLQEYGKKLHPSLEIGTVYMIGDNPRSDIAGANDFESRCGYKWKSVLVETGIYVPGSVPAYQPDHTAKDVKEAVQWVLRKEKLANGAE